MYPSQVFRLMLGDESLEEVGNTPACRGILSLTRRERSRDEGKEGAIDEGISIDEEQPWAFRTFHQGNIKRPRLRGTRAFFSIGDRRINAAGALRAKETLSGSVESISTHRHLRRI